MTKDDLVLNTLIANWGIVLLVPSWNHSGLVLQPVLLALLQELFASQLDTELQRRDS